MMVASIATEPVFSSGVPRSLFEWRLPAPSRILPTRYDVTPDGNHFVMIREHRQPLVELNVMLDWSAELERLVPED